MRCETLSLVIILCFHSSQRYSFVNWTHIWYITPRWHNYAVKPNLLSSYFASIFLPKIRYILVNLTYSLYITHLSQGKLLCFIKSSTIKFWLQQSSSRLLVLFSTLSRLLASAWATMLCFRQSPIILLFLFWCAKMHDISLSEMLRLLSYMSINNGRCISTSAPLSAMRDFK